MSIIINDLIHDYLEAAQSSIEIMKRYFGVDHLLQAVGQGMIKARGVIQNEAKLTFSFHGYGCAVTTNNYEVDFDFDANGGCTTFDAWRLMLFAQSQPGRYGGLDNRECIEQEFQDLKKKGVLVSLDDIAKSSFYRLTS